MADIAFEGHRGLKEGEGEGRERESKGKEKASNGRRAERASGAASEMKCVKFKSNWVRFSSVHSLFSSFTHSPPTTWTLNSPFGGIPPILSISG